MLIRNHQLALPDDPELLDELSHVRLRETAPGVLRLEQDADRYKDRAIVLALAATRLLDRPPSVRPAISTKGPPLITADLLDVGL